MFQIFSESEQERSRSLKIVTPLVSGSYALYFSRATDIARSFRLVVQHSNFTV